MELETQVSPDAETQNPAPVEATQAPEVVEPESQPTEQPDETPEHGDKPDKAVKSMQRRLDRVTALRYQAEAKAQEAERRWQETQQRLAQYEQPEQQQPQGPDPVTLAREISRIEKVTEKANAVAKEGKAKFPDFDRAVQAVNRDAGPMFDAYGRATPLGEAILSSDTPAAVLHAIGSDPDLAADLADMSPIQQARRIARLEIELSKPKDQPKSNAPKPIQPVKASGSQSGPSVDDSPEEWRRKFIAQRQQRNRF